MPSLNFTEHHNSRSPDERFGMEESQGQSSEEVPEAFSGPAPACFAAIRVHDLKHTFGRRLRAAGVTEEDRKALLGHKNGSITSHYSAAELGKLIDEANRISATDSREPTLKILRRMAA
ncbi:Integrase (fragment) [Pseudomonas sp. 8Z]